jgi:DNA-binding transcriptional ArsR family regulator
LLQHLARLWEDGLVATRRDGQSIFYSLANEDASRIMAVLYDLFCADTPRAPRAKDVKRKKKG